MGKTSSFVTAAVLGAGLFAGATAPVAGQSNPVDRVSNPTARDYTDVEISPQDMSPSFVRDGVVAEPQLFSTIRAGLAQSEVRARLGEPLQMRGRAWDYNFQLKMPDSENYLVCQYKVMFDRSQFVQNTVWRRRQCQRIASGDVVAQ